MDLLLGFFTGFLSIYLAFTNTLAWHIEQFFNTAGTTSPSFYDAVDLVKLTPSGHEQGGTIPDILIQNAAYQQASAMSALDDFPTTTSIPDALVNVYCRYVSGNQIQATTGTGFFVHADGVILTNAHVAQLLLLAEMNGEKSECVIRTGSPATPEYTADLLYISPAWLREHAGIFTENQPKGTGERDYALLYINGALNNQPMPRVFPALPIDTELLKVDAVESSVTAAGYPAGAIITEGPDASLVAATSPTEISELMTFGSNYADLFTIAGSAVGEQGSSGGPVIDADQNVIGMISTRGDDSQFGAGSLRAITLSYVDRTITEETGFGLRENLTGNLPYRAQLYKETIVPFLITFMQWELE